MAKIPEIFKEELPRYKDFWPWVEALAMESERGKVLVSTGFMEEQLKRVLISFMRDVPDAAQLFEGPAAPLSTFSSRIQMCFVLGLITDEEHSDLTLIRRIRNDFAHRVDTTFETARVKTRCSELQLKLSGKFPLDEETFGAAEAQFLSSVAYLTLHLEHRPDRIAGDRRRERSWMY